MACYYCKVCNKTHDNDYMVCHLCARCGELVCEEYGVDLYTYSLHDPEKREVEVEMCLSCIEAINSGEPINEKEEVAIRE